MSRCVSTGAYSKDGEGGYGVMTDIFPNDELSYVAVPEGLSCYVAGKYSFQVGGDGVSEHGGAVAEMVVPDGMVSSVTVWDSTRYNGHEELLATVP